MSVRWRQAVDLNWIRTKAAILDGDAGQVAGWQKEMDQTSGIFTATCQRAIEFVQSPESKALIQDIDEARAAYRTPRSDLLKRRVAGEDVIGALKTQLRPLADTYGGAI